MGEIAKTIEDYASRMTNFITPEGMEAAMAFQPRADDILIPTFPKAGTTWMQQICHGLRSNGDMNFREITEVTPWIELAHDCGWNLDQPWTPRVFKSHMNAHGVQKGGKYIMVIRNPYDTFASFYNFLGGWMFDPACISIEDYIKHLMERDHPGGSYWEHLISWYDRRNDDDVLYLTFEGMKENLPEVVRRVAGFMGITDPAAIEIATEQSTFDFMKAHEGQFNDNLIAKHRNAALGLPADAGSSKVKSGKIGGHKAVLTDACRDMLDAEWARVVAPRGFADFDALRASLNKEGVI